MNAANEKTAHPEVDGHFGLCPHCHKHDGYVNIGKGHWFVCHEHKVMWCIGYNFRTPDIA